MRLCKRKKNEKTRTFSIGLCLDDTGQVRGAAAVSDETGQIISPERETGPLTFNRITATLPTWGAHTHPVELKLPRYSGAVDTAAAIIEKAVKGDAETKKLFGTNQTDLIAYDFTRQSEKAATYLTIATLRDAVEAAQYAQASLETTGHVRVEPLSHAIWRAARAAALAHLQTEPQDMSGTTSERANRAEPSVPVVVVLALTTTGYGSAIGPISLSSPVYAIEQEETQNLNGGLTGSVALGTMVREALDQLSDSMLSESTLTGLRINPNSRLVAFVTCEDELRPLLVEALGPVKDRIDLVPLRLPDEEKTAHPYAVAALGAALSPVTASAGVATDPDRAMTVDLAETLQSRLDRVAREKAEAIIAQQAARRAQTAQPFLIIPALLIAIAFGWWYGVRSEGSALHQEEDRQKTISTKLAAYIKRHDDEKKTFTYYQELSKEIFARRQNQTRVAQLQVDLDRLWPVDDPSWTVSTIQSIQGGKNGVEIRGKTRQLDAFKTFAKRLEFEPGNTFTDIRPTIGEIPAGGASAAGSAGASPPNPGAKASGLGPGPYEWTIQATYTLPQANGPAQTQAPSQRATATPSPATPAAQNPKQGGMKP